MSSMAFSIGNENCYVAAVRSGGIEIFDNEYSLRATSSYVAFNDRSIDVGIDAKKKLASNFMNTVYGIKKMLGKKINNPSAGKALEYFPHTVVEMPTGDIGIKLKYFKNDRIFSLIEIMAMILFKLKLIAEDKVNDIGDYVLSVPVYYTDTERRALIHASKIADLNHAYLMNESTAIALDYGFYRQDLDEKTTKHVIFIDMGSSAITVTACAFKKDKLKILGSVWDSIGGNDFDNVLVQYFVKDFEKRFNIEVMSSKKALIALMLECESLKRQMSVNSQEIEIEIKCIVKDCDVKGRMKRELFQHLSSKILNRISITLQRILNETGLTTDDNYSVELVGGSCQVPDVKDLIRNIFLREPNILNHKEAIARGCALRNELSSKTRDFVIEDIPSFDIKLKWENMQKHKEEVIVFSRNDKVPAYKTITISMSKRFIIEVSQKDRVTSEKTKIANFILDNFPEKIENTVFSVKVKACLDANGIFTIQRATAIVRGEAIAFLYKDQNIDFDEDDSMDGPNGHSSVNFELSVTSDVPELSQIESFEFMSIRRIITSKHIQEEKRVKTRNELEEYIYDVRSKINHELTEFMENETTESLCKYLCGTENWLFNNKEMPGEEFMKTLAECRNLFEPVFQKKREWERRAGSVSVFENALHESVKKLTLISNLDKNNAHCVERDNLKKIYGDAKLYLNRSTDLWSKLRKYEDSPLFVVDMRDVFMKYQTNFEALYFPLKNKLSNSVQEPPAQESSSDGDFKEKNI